MVPAPAQGPPFAQPDSRRADAWRGGAGARCTTAAALGLAAVLAGAPLTAAGGADGSEPDVIRPSLRAQLVASPELEIEPSAPARLDLRVDAPETLPLGAFVRIRGVPPGITVVGAKQTVPGSFMVPLWGLDGVRLRMVSDDAAGADLIVALVDLDGSVLAERTVGLRVKPAVPPVLVSSSPRVAAVAPSLPLPATLPAARPVLPEQRGPTAEETAQAERLLGQGDRYLAQGNIAIARQYFMRAAELGLAIAAFRMGATYDPSELTRPTVQGVVPNIPEARRWYQRALDLDVPEARARLERLGNR